MADGDAIDESSAQQQLREPLLPSNATGYGDSDKDIVLPRCPTLCCRAPQSPPPPPLRLNHNVFLTLLLCVLYGLSDSLWSGTVMAAYLKRLGRERNGPVGDVEAVSGLASLLSALPVGYLADKVGRAKVVASGGALILVTAGLHAALLGWIGTDEQSIDDDPHKRHVAFYLFGAVMALWGVAGGIVNGPSQALYADSTPAGSRSKYYVYLFACYMLSSCLGPAVSIGLFQTLGDDWDLLDLRTVLYVGLALEAVSAGVMFFFDDDKALDEEHRDQDHDQGGEGEGEDDGAGGGADVDTDADVAGDSESQLLTNDEEEGGSKLQDIVLSAAVSEDRVKSSPSVDDNSDAEDEEVVRRDDDGQEEPNNGEDNDDIDDDRRFGKHRKIIPIMLCTQSLVFAVGSGMTVKFFPLFFRDEVKMSPSHVQLIYVIVPVAMVALSGVAEKIASSGFGRVQTMILLNSVGVSCLYAMVFGKTFLDVHPWVLVPVYVLRTALMNCTYPLNESILMDYVPKNERARWKSLDSVASFGWCGSAALGGWLTDRFDYTYTFFITAIIQSIGVLAFVPLIPLVPRKEGSIPGR